MAQQVQPRFSSFPRWECIGFLLLAGTLACASPVLPEARPNVLVIVADDLGFSDLGALGSEIPTPHLDELAGEGMLFTNFHVAATCSPTRAMILSGVDNHRAGLGNMGEWLTEEQRGKPGYEGHLNHRVRTLASRLRQVGYRTGMAGKWHLGDGSRERPHARGFDRSLALMEGAGSAWNDGSPAPNIGERTHFTRNGELIPRPDGFSATLYVDEMIDFISTGADDRPFFGYLAFQAVHWPHHAPDRYLEQVRGRYAAGYRAVRDQRFARQRQLGLFPEAVEPSALGDAVPEWETLSEAEREDETARMEAYAAMAIAMDDEIGRLIEFLETTDRLDETLVIFVSDNGPDPSQPERSAMGRDWYRQRYPRTEPADLGRPGSFPSIGFAWARVSATPLDSHKGAPGEGGLRVPLIARYPGKIAAGRKSTVFGYATDIVPTVLDAAGLAGVLDAEDVLDGRSLWPVMAGASNDRDDHAVGYELMGNGAFFRGDLKLVRVHGGPWRLFDLALDPGETNDLAESRPVIFDQMREDYEAYEEAVGVVTVPADFDVMKQLLRASEAAGSH